MATVKKGKDEMKRGRQKESFVADILRVLKTEHGLPRHPDGKDIYISELGKIHNTSGLIRR
jgi:hypothetical protein